MTTWDKTKFFAGFMAIYLAGLMLSMAGLFYFIDWLMR